MKSADQMDDRTPDSESFAPPMDFLVRWRRYRHILRTRWWVLVLMVGLSVAVAGWHVFSQPVRFLSKASMMVSGQISLPGSAVYSEEANNFFGTQIALMESQMVRVAAEAALRAKRPDLVACPVSISAGQQARASLFLLQAVGDKPEYTQALLDAVMQEYINAKSEMRSQKSETTVSAIAEQLDALEKKIKTGEDELINFQKQNNVNFLQTSGNTAGTYLNGIDKKLADLNTEYQLLNLLSLDDNLNRQRTANTSSESGGAVSAPDPAMAGSSTQADYVRTKQQIKLLKAKVADFSQFLKPKHPIIVRLNDEISLQEKLVSIYQEESKTQLAGQRESVRLQIENLENERKQWNAKALDLSGRIAQYDSLKAKLDRMKALYDKLLSSMQAVDVNKNIDQNVVAILEKASPASPLRAGHLKALTMGLLVGLCLGIGILFVNDSLDDRAVSAGEFCAQFTERILGRIPREKSKELVLLHPSDPAFGEAFSGIRSSLMFLPNNDTPPKIILVTSAVPNEGKSTVAANLAATLARGGAKTLLVDGDLRRGRLHRLFGIPNEVGFSEVISGEVPWRSATQQCKLEHLTILARGKSKEEQSKFLLGQITTDWLEQVRKEFDFVILDSAPVLATDDTTMLAPKVDGVVYVARLGFSSSKSIRDATDLLYARQVTVLGMVLNAVDPSLDGGGHYNYLSYHSTSEKV